MSQNNFTIFDFIDNCVWYELYDFQKPLHNFLFFSFIWNFLHCFNQQDIYILKKIFWGNNKHIDLKIGIDLSSYYYNEQCYVHFWCDSMHFRTNTRIPYQVLNYQGYRILNKSIITKIKIYCDLNSKNIIRYARYKQ